jgi:hypothetical protein
MLARIRLGGRVDDPYTGHSIFYDGGHKAHGGFLMLQITYLAVYSSTSVARIIYPLLVLLIMAAVLIGALAFVRRKVHADDSPSAPRDFTLGDLRTLHREGKLTNEEFERAKAKLVHGVRETLKKEAKPSMVEQPFPGEMKETFADTITLAENDETDEPNDEDNDDDEGRPT